MHLAAVHAAPPLADYYQPVAHLHGADLAPGLQHLLSQTHRPLGYDRARDTMLETHYRNESGILTDLYTGAGLPGVTDRPSALRADVNTEHIWPQSQGASGSAKSDLHHLGATLQSVNEYRWHLPFGAVVDAQNGAAPYAIPAGSGSVGFDASGRLVFEPRDAVKGAIARSLLYVHTRYASSPDRAASFDARPFTDSLPTLLAWHAAHLPDAAELRRNDLVQAAQGNRNPFVDHPEWAAPLFGGVATTPVPRPRAAQVEEWARFLRDPSGFHQAQRAARAVTAAA